MHDIETPSTDEIEALQFVIAELTRAIAIADMPMFERLRELLIQARSAAEAQLGRPPASELQ